MVLSLLEKQTSHSVIKKIYLKLPMESLKKNIAIIFYRYTLMYKDKYDVECLDHNSEENENVPGSKDQKPEEYYELITETGFNIFFLI
jgi:hypothetical protein